MILTCPTCATRYFVEETEIGHPRRRVKCAACGNIWSEEGEARPDASGEAPHSDPGAPSISPIIAEPLLTAATPRPRAERSARPSHAWLVALVTLALLVGAAVVLRTSITAAWPQAAGVYRILGLTAKAP